MALEEVIRYLKTGGFQGIPYELVRVSEDGYVIQRVGTTIEEFITANQIQVRVNRARGQLF